MDGVEDERVRRAGAVRLPLEQPLAGVGRELGILLTTQQPVGGMSGGVNQRLVRQFRMAMDTAPAGRQAVHVERGTLPPSWVVVGR